jgi:hypothetical protein
MCRASIGSADILGCKAQNNKEIHDPQHRRPAGDPLVLSTMTSRPATVCCRKRHSRLHNYYPATKALQMPSPPNR